MTRTIFKIEILALLVLMVAGCGGKKADDYAHQVLDRHGQDWKRVEAMVVSMREAVSSEAAVEELGAKDIGELGREAAHKAMVYGVSEVRRAKTATLVKLDRFGQVCRATVDLSGPSAQVPPKVIVFMMVPAEGKWKICMAN